MTSTKSRIQHALSITSVNIQSALETYAPVRHETWDVPEINAVMYFGAALQAGKWRVYPEAPFRHKSPTKKGQRVDLFAIDEQKGALLVEAKRIWSPRHANLVYNDMNKLEGGRLEGRFNGFGLGKLWFAVMVFTHRIEVSNWW